MTRQIVGVTMGDPAGVGGEVLVRGLYELIRCLEAGELPASALAIRGDGKALCSEAEPFSREDKAEERGRGVSLGLSKYAEAVGGLRGLGWRIYGDRCRLEEIAKAADLPPLERWGCVEVVEVETEGAAFGWGRLTEVGASAQVLYLQRALCDVKAGAIGALVTGPIHKQALSWMGVGHVGHTEWLAADAGVSMPVMMLAGPRLRVVPATIHIALREVAEALTPERLRSVIAVTAEGMQRWLGFDAPHLGVCGLNPHAGDGGLMGEEEERWIAPLLGEIAKKGAVRLVGPLPADTAFYFAAQGAYDAVIAMYHDQALAPLKVLHFDEAINITLGLPYLRTSVDHGTAYDIAGKGKASARSMLHALVVAGLSLSLAFCEKQH